MPRAADAIEDWLGEPLWDFAAKSAGVGLSGTILEIVKGYGLASGVSDEILQAIIGLAMRKWGDKVHEQVPNVGSGVLYHLVGRAVFEERIAPMLTKQFTKKPAYGASQIDTAFAQKYGRNPTPQERAFVQKHLAQQQQPKQPIGQAETPPPGTPMVDYHYSHLTQ